MEKRYKFYEKEYLNLIEENKVVAGKRDFAFGLLTSLIVVTIIPLLDMIIEMEPFGLKLATLIIFAIFCINVLVSIIFTMYVNFKKFREYEIKSLQEVEDGYDELEGKYITQPEKLEQEVENGYVKYYIKKYDELYKAIDSRRERVEILFKILAVNISWEVILGILVIISKIFF